MVPLPWSMNQAWPVPAVQHGEQLGSDPGLQGGAGAEARAPGLQDVEYILQRNLHRLERADHFQLREHRRTKEATARFASAMGEDQPLIGIETDGLAECPEQPATSPIFRDERRHLTLPWLESAP